MKVAYLLGSLNRGGTETLMVDSLKQAAKTHFACLLVHRKTGLLLSAFQQTGVPLRHLPVRHRLDVAYLFRLRSLLRNEQVQVVHAQMPVDAFLAYLACLGTGIRIVLSFHGFDIGYSRLGRFMIWLMLRRADLLLFVSSHLRNYFQSAYALPYSEQKYQVLYNGIDFQKLSAFEPANIRRELGIPTDSLLIGTVGNFVGVRDQLTICRFLKQLHETGVDFHMVFIGAKNTSAPNLYNECVSFCEDSNLTRRVHFLGSRADVPAILPELNAFVYASNHDTFGIAVIEAMAVCIPVFVNDWAVMREITNNGEYVTLYQTKDDQDLLVKFTDFIKQPESFREKARAAQIFVQQRYAIEQHFQQLHQRYQTLTSV